MMGRRESSVHMTDIRRTTIERERWQRKYKRGKGQRNVILKRSVTIRQDPHLISEKLSTAEET